MEDFKLYVLGCRGSRPMTGIDYAVFGGATSCYIMRADKYALVLDCGTGFYEAGPYLAGCTHVDILLTHLHYDHIIGLLNWGAIPLESRVRVYTVRANNSAAASPVDFIKPPYWPVSPVGLETHDAELDTTFSITERVSVRFSAANHPNGAAIIRVDTDCGSLCLVCDWEHGRHAVPTDMTTGCSMVFYDGMFDDSEYPAYAGWGHSTWQEGVKLAKARNIPKLMITHHVPERTDKQLLEMESRARRIFKNIRFIRAGDIFTLQGKLVN